MSQQAQELTPVQKVESKFGTLAIKGMTYPVEKRFLDTMVANNSQLQDCTTRSKYEALLNAAAIGLTLNPAEKLAYVIPRNVKVGDNQWEKRAFFEPSYMGLLRVATDSGVVDWVQANVVYDQDKFVDNGAGNRPEHTYQPFSKERGEFVGVYCVAKLSSGDYLTTMMSAEEVESIKARNEAVKKGYKSPWGTDFNEMAKKAVIRRAFKTWPRSDGTRFAEAVNLSNENEGFEPLTEPAIQSGSPDQKKEFDRLIEANDPIGMYLFSLNFDLNDASSRGASEWTNLMHSFKKGTKGKYQDLVNDLKRQGQEAIEGYASMLLEAEANDDLASVQEVMADIDGKALEAAYDKAVKLGSSHLKLSELMKSAA